VEAIVAGRQPAEISAEEPTKRARCPTTGRGTISRRSFLGKITRPSGDLHKAALMTSRNGGAARDG
jgi:hypothetical protein